VDDFEYPAFEDEPAPRRPRAKGFQLPGGLSLQAAAAILCVGVSLAALYLIFGPSPDEGTVVAPATNTPLVAGTTGTPGATRAAAPPTRAAAAIAPAAPSPTALLAAPAVTPTVAAASLPTTPPLADAPGGPLVVDGFARVAGTDSLGLRLRFGAGLDTATIRWADENEVLRIVGDPLTSDGETWWRVQDALGNRGWAAATFLVPATAPPAWAPPIASPTFESTGAPEGDG
jgi:hypothetical protein